MKAGHTMHFVPGHEHALIPNAATGDHPWIMGRKYRDKEGAEQVEELEGHRLTDYLNFLKRRPSPDPDNERANLVFLRPHKVWPARVKWVNEDGTLALCVKCPGGFELHHDAVAVDHGKKIPHSCHVPPKE